MNLPRLSPLSAPVSGVLRFLSLLCLALAVPARATEVLPPALSNLGAGQATLSLTSSEAGTGYVTLLSSPETVGDAAQTKAGQNGAGTVARRHGSLAMAAGTAGTYLARNLAAATTYTVVFTAEDAVGNLAPVQTATFTTPAARVLDGMDWTTVGSAGFSAGQTEYTSLALGSDGTPYVAYRDGANSNKATVMKHNGSAWEPVGIAGFSAGAAEYTSLALGSDGTPYVAYRDSANINKATVMKYDGSAWVAVGRAGFSAGQADYTSLALGADGTPYVAYRDGGNDSKATVMKYDGSVWVPVGSAGFSAGQVDYTNLALGADGTPYVAYIDGASNSKVTVMKYNGSGWETVGAAGFSGGAALFPSLALGSDGTLCVAYMDSSNGGAAAVMKYDGSAWALVGSAGFSGGQASYTSLALGADDTAYVAYMDRSGAVTVKKYHGSEWVTVGGVGFSGIPAPYTSLALSADGTPYVAYMDGSNGAKATVMTLTPAVTSVAVPAADDYGFGEALAFTVHYSSPVTVTGTPTLPLTLRPVSPLRNASYAPAQSTSTALVFTYTVQAGDSAPEGIALGSAIALNGGTMHGSDGYPAVLGLNAIGSTAGVRIMPDAKILSHPAAITKSDTATFTITGSGTGYESSLDGAAYVVATDWVWLTNLADGSHTLKVRAVDYMGNVDETPASYTWTVDTTVPSAPAITMVTPAGASGTAEAGSTVEVFSGSTSLGTATADGTGHWSLAVTLTNGAYAITAVTTDAAGNTGPASAAIMLTVDLAGPSVTSIARLMPGPVTTADAVTWRVTFSKAVTGVALSDFKLTRVDGSAAGLLSRVEAGRSAAEYIVTATGLSGIGTLRLDLNASGTGIVDGAGNTISGGFALGQSYTHTRGSTVVDWGQGSATGERSVPVSVGAAGALAGKTVVQVAVGREHTLALCSDGTIVSWGLSNRDGQFGDGTVTWTGVPVSVSTAEGSSALFGKTVVAVSAGYDHSLALCSDGTVAAWGNNDTGQLGDGSPESRSVPVLVDTSTALAGKVVVAISAGVWHSVALCSDGTVATWGEGPLGDNTTRNSSRPVAVNAIYGVSALFGKTVVAVSAGYDHSLALCSDGTVVSWGGNAYGALGDGLIGNSRLAPVAVYTGSSAADSALYGKTVRAVSAGLVHSLALCDDGTVVAWGSNGSGQLGDNSTTPRLVPVAVNATAGLSTIAGRTVVSIVAAASHSLAFCDDGTLVTWGDNVAGQLGTNSARGSLVPVAVDRTEGVSALFSKDVYQVASGSNAYHSAVLASPALISAVATPTAGTYKAGDTLAFTLTPSEALTVSTTTGTPRLALTVGSETRYATYASGSGTTRLIFTYTVQPGDTDADGIALASTSIDLNGGTLIGAGDWPVALAMPAYTLPTIAVDTVAPAVPTITSTAPVGPTTNRAYTMTGTAEAGSTMKIYNAGNLVGTATSDAEGHWSCALTLDDGVIALTVTASDALGNESAAAADAAWTIDTTLPAVATIARIQPGPVTLADTQKWRVTFTEPVTGVDPTDFALTQVDGSATADSVTVTPVPAGASSSAVYLVEATGVTGIGALRLDVKSSGTGIADGAGNALAAGFTQGQPYTHAPGSIPVAWGKNSAGQLGLGTKDDSVHREPVLVPRTGALAGKTVVSVSAGWLYSLALCSDGTVAAWGENPSGELGNNSSLESFTPASVDMTGVLNGKIVVAVSAGYGHALALDSEGKVYAWGFNYFAQLGNCATRSESRTPVAVDMSGALNGKTVVSVSAGWSHSLALDSEGKVYAWGFNGDGQLGNPSVGDESSTPVAVDMSTVLAGKTVVAVSAGQYHSLALCSDGTVAAWGSNGAGQLGNNSAENSNTPVAVNTEVSSALPDRTVYAVGSGCYASHSFALASITVDGVAPTLPSVTLVSSNATPSLATAGDTVTLSFRASETLQTPTVTLAGATATATYESGTSTWTAAHTVAAADAEGSVTFSIAFSDVAGNAGTTVIATTDESAVMIDLTGPETTLTSQPATLSKSASATFAFSATDAARYEASLDGGAYAAATSPATLTGLADGSHTFAVRAVDAAGNVDATPANYTWMVDTVVTPPVVTPPETPAVPTTTPTITGTAEAGSTVKVYEGATLLGTTTADATGAWSFTPPTPLGHGVHALTVTATDAAGNVSQISSLQLTIETPSLFSALSARAPAGTGEQTLILGFVFAGGGKPTLVRGVGPGISTVSGYMRDPQLRLYTASGVEVASNDDWAGSSELSDAFVRTGAGALDPASKDAALFENLTGNVYTAHVSGAAGTTGVALAEAYDASLGDKTKRLTALSVRNQVGVDDAILIAGFVISGDVPKRVVVRGVGPGISTVSGYLRDPQLQVWRLNTLVTPAKWELVGENDDWDHTATTAALFKSVGMGELASDSKDAALVLTLEPGIYTAQVSGVGRTTGVGLAEIYEAP